MAQLSLYRRYRPRRFSEIRGQDHVVRALRNAVAGDSESHAYLFSGPRGTGKTSTARIFAKALNCEALADGEPCGECESCQAMDAGRSFDLFELDAASNNGVDAVRELVERTAVGSPGRTKVYILDEVHMLTAAASNALLKTLEEPPDHVRFVLATTDPQKVLPTIRSRTQHYEFQLLSAQDLEDYVRWIAADAGLDIDEEAVAHVVRQGRGSARDTLSALDQVVAAGGVLVRGEPVEELFDALEQHDTGAAVRAAADALAQGHDPRVLAEAFMAELRSAFLLSVGAEVGHLVDVDRQRLGGRAVSLGTAALTRAMEAIGVALVDMRQAADPRIPFEVALVRLTAGTSAPSEGAAGSAVSPGSSVAQADDGRFTALSARIERLEARLRSIEAAGEAAEAATAAASAPRRGTAADARPTPPPVPPRRREAATSADAGAHEEPAPPPAPDAAAPAPSPAAAPPTAAPSPAAPSPGAPGMPDRDALVIAFGDTIVQQLRGIAKAIYAAGRFVSVDDAGAVFALENAPTRERAERYRVEVEQLLVAHFGRPVPLRLVAEHDVGGGAASAPRAPTPAPPATPRSSSPQEARQADAPTSGGPPAADRRPPPAPPRSRESAERPAPPAGAKRSRTSRPGARPPTPARPSTSQLAESSGSGTTALDATASGTKVGDDEDLYIDLAELEDAGDVVIGGLDKLAAAFPGSELIEEPGDG